jgi:hypothetical protein
MPRDGEKPFQRECGRSLQAPHSIQLSVSAAKVASHNAEKQLADGSMK